MQGHEQVEQVKRYIPEWVINYVLRPFRKGLFGFAGFFTLLLIVKYLGYLLGNTDYFIIDLTDIALSCIGFVMLFLIRVLENFTDNSEKIKH